MSYYHLIMILFYTIDKVKSPPQNVLYAGGRGQEIGRGNRMRGREGQLSQIPAALFEDM